jgi:hypothetical protein
MGIDYAVACFDCKVFIDLHKWPIVEEMRARFWAGEYDRDLFPANPSYHQTGKRPSFIKDGGTRFLSATREKPDKTSNPGRSCRGSFLMKNVRIPVWCYCVIRLTADQVARSLREARTDPECNFDYIQGLLPGVISFVKEHWTHNLFLSSDLGDEPWDFGEEDWWQWKTIPAYFDYSGHLPRNLIEDERIRDWASAISHLEAHHPEWSMPLEPEGPSDAMKYKWAFECLLLNHKPVSQP